jgi:hypothetical protein
MIPFLATVGGGIAEGLQKYRQNKIDEQKRRIDEMLANAQMTDLTEGRRQRQEQIDLMKAGEARDADKYGRQPFLDSAATGQDVELSPEVQAKYPGLRMQTAALAGERTRADQQAMDTELHAGIERGMRAEESAAQIDATQALADQRRLETDMARNPQNYPQLQNTGQENPLLGLSLKTMGIGMEDFKQILMHTLTLSDEEFETYAQSLADTDELGGMKNPAAFQAFYQTLKSERKAILDQYYQSKVQNAQQVDVPLLGGTTQPTSELPKQEYAGRPDIGYDSMRPDIAYGKPPKERIGGALSLNEQVELRAMPGAPVPGGVPINKLLESAGRSIGKNIQQPAGRFMSDIPENVSQFATPDINAKMVEILLSMPEPQRTNYFLTLFPSYKGKLTQGRVSEDLIYKAFGNASTH